ncbi:hybrid sensor histidine kinase/response regulator [Pseudoxanthomonas sangjuensis]|uniref:hybrid sensor histidine kinase/response regulator n=1 Tax=Pseudoxanthomonas sangjuensis TaxID=1503750 RepID=UPI001FE9E8AB|nr:hybrid sensor histidine kinase/response regulator [Pseudoxanthomonas sangjuensis]
MRFLTVRCFWWRCIAVLSALACVPAWAGLPEIPRLNQLSVANGLPTNIVYDVAEDADGYLWFATLDGLARYDGLDFRIWRREDGLGDNEIDALFVDTDNRLWIGTETAGVVVLDAARRRFQSLRQVGGVRLDASPVWDIVRTADGAYWFGTAGAGLYRLRTDGKLDQFLPKEGDPRSLPGLIVTGLELGADGSLWIATSGGAARWTGKDFLRMPDSEYTVGLLADRAGNAWTRTITRGRYFGPDGRRLPLPAGLPADTPTYGALLQDRDGSYWLSMAKGLAHAEDGATHPASLYSNLTRGSVIPQFERSLLGSDGGLWFTSQDAGVWHLPSNWRRFSVLMHDATDPASQGNPQVFGIAPSASGSMWLVGTGCVLDELDPETGEIRHAYSTVPRRVINSVLESADGKVWMGSSDRLARFDPASGEIREWGLDSGADAVLADDLQWIAQDRDGLLWTWSVGSGVQVRTAAGRVVDTIRLDDGRGLESSLNVRQLQPGPEGRIWLAGSQGLLGWDPQARRFAPVPGAPDGAVDGFDLAPDGTLWLARFGTVEAYRFERGGLRLLRRVPAQGMPQVAFRGITADRHGILWLASNRGLVRVDPQQGAARVYGINDGLPGQEIQLPPVPRPQDGRLIVSASHGLAVFDPVVVRPSTAQPRLAIDSITLGHGAGAVALPTDAAFRIDHGNRDLRVVARLLAFDNVAGNRYRFRLSGFDDDWVEVGAKGERSFARLAPGRYRLEIAGRTADDVWSRTRIVAFEVAPPWWRTWWALAGFAVLAVLLAWAAAAAYRRRIRRRAAWQLAEHKRELAEQASLAKTRFLATLGHEVRTPMTGVLGMSELLLGTDLDEKQRGYTAAIQGAGKHLLRLVNDALDLARIEAGKLELDEQEFDLRELVAGVAALVAPNAQRRGLRFDSDSAAGSPRMLRGDPMRVRQILLNLLNNAVKFTERGGIGLRAQPREGGGVRFVVSDTGPGISVEQQARLFQRFEQADGARTTARYGGSGLGLAICQELALAMGGSVRIDSAPGAGTRFIVDLPLPEATHAAAVPEAATATVAAPASRALSVLLVEDDPTVAEVMAGLLQAQGHAVRHAPHGLAALAEVSGDGFDIALLDLDLPGLDGLALARQLRAQGFAAPLLAVTARADADAEPAARAAGFDGFLRKPVTGAMLAEAIEQALAAGPAA